MDFTTFPGTHVRERRRAAVVARRIERRGERLHTRNFRRNQRLADLAFLMVLCLTALAGAVLATS
jgi:hypothetical protein